MALTDARAALVTVAEVRSLFIWVQPKDMKRPLIDGFTKIT